MKAWSGAKRVITESLNTNINIEDQVEHLIDTYALEMNWGDDWAMGTLPNGDWVGVG